MTHSLDLQMAQAIHGGDAASWNALVQRQGPAILAASMGWCEHGCLVPRSRFGCILKNLGGHLPEPAEDPELCREGWRLYEYTCLALKARLGAYQGHSNLASYICGELADIRQQYLEQERGRLDIPAALDGAEPLAIDVFRLGCRMGSREAIAQRLAITPDEVSRLQEVAAQRLGSDENAPWGRPPAADVADTLQDAPMGAAMPAWINQGVVDRSAGDPGDVEPGPGNWRKKVLSQPDWLWGLAVGAVTTAGILLVAIPFQEYAKVVTDPGDVLLAHGLEPLDSVLLAKLVAARAQLEAGKIDSAMHNLNAVLGARPDNQEARWLLASTYDRLGDQSRAARHYKLFIDVNARQRTVIDDRVKRAEHRLGTFSDLP